MESVTPVSDPKLKKDLEQTFQVYLDDNSTAWDMQPDGSYTRRKPKRGQKTRPAQETLIDKIGRQAKVT
jgi:polyphosphate kinase